MPMQDIESLTENIEDQLNNIKEGKLTNPEKEEIIKRIDGARVEERQLILRRFTTQELYSEIGRRLVRADQFTDEMAQLISDYRRDYE